MVESEFDRPNIVQPMVNGIDAINIAFRRPYISLMSHPVNAPIGCTKNAQLAVVMKYLKISIEFQKKCLKIRFYRSTKLVKQLFEEFRWGLVLYLIQSATESQYWETHRINHCLVKPNYLPEQLMSVMFKPLAIK